MRTIVYLIDDDASFRTAVTRLLRASGYEVEPFPSAGVFLKHRPDESKPGCVLLDAHMPGLTGLELQKRLAGLGSTLPIIFLSGHGDIHMGVQAIKSGAEDFLTKPVSRDVLMQAIDHAIESRQVLRNRVAERHEWGHRIGSLTPREREVFELVVRGRLNKQIAYELGTTERTIKAHRHKVMEKTQVRSLAELVSLAVGLGLTNSISMQPREDISTPQRTATTSLHGRLALVQA